MNVDDPFALLDLPRRFEIDRAALQAAYLRKSATLHPDRYADPIEAAEAAGRAAALNRARAELIDDERRANALLALLGGPDKEKEKELPDGFLMAMMETRQDMEEILATGDPAKRRELEDRAEGERDARLEKIADLFRQATQQDGGSPPADLLREIRIELNALRYIERMIEQLPPPEER
ncbi:MAG: iron-sulfur cluster co-chaperone HscB C-terminal domain-containing protein [Planctomycetota bacterium]|nr:iron-sulfur cluster co-chaperone HscB C-terminal domain-containing protein [Planctomycetota bacterium]